MKYIVDTIDVPRDALEALHARLALVLLHARLTGHFTEVELAQAREMAAGVGFRFSWGAATGFVRQLLQAVMHRFPGMEVARFRSYSPEEDRRATISSQGRTT